MAGRGRFALALLLIVAAAAVLGGCGGGDSTTSGEDGTAAARPETTAADGGSGGKDDSQSGGSGGGSSAEFVTPGADNSVQEYGKEADAADRKAASAAVEEFMAARAAGDWEAVCAQVSANVLASIEEVTASGGGCAGAFEAIGARLAADALANPMAGPVASLRAEGAQGFALFHGKEDRDYFIQVSRETGGWKVNALEPIELP